MRLVKLVVLCGLTAAAHAQWPQFRGNPALTGVASTAPAEKLRVVWSYEAGDAIEHYREQMERLVAV